SSPAPGKKFKGPPAQSSGQPQGQGQFQGPRPQFTPRRGQSTPSVGSSLGMGFRGPAPTSSACPHCLKWHKRECWRVTGACLRCGSTEHQLRNCPCKTTIAAPTQTDRPAPTPQRRRKSGKSEVVGPSQRPKSEPAERPEGRPLARAYAMRAQEEQDAPDIIRGTFSLYNTSVHALVDPGSTHSYICINLPVERRIQVEESDQDILVTNPLGHSAV
ncbi:hypothetical protein P3X46_018369, partial [Hevea brasiliensis]